MYHNVRRLVTDKPEGYDFKPGQATLVAVDKNGLREEKRKDLFLKDNLEVDTKGRLLLTFTQETVEGAEKGRIDKDFLKKHLQDFDQFFYVCGPPEMVDSVTADLKELGADPDKIVVEES